MMNKSFGAEFVKGQVLFILDRKLKDFNRLIRGKCGIFWERIKRRSYKPLLRGIINAFELCFY